MDRHDTASPLAWPLALTVAATLGTFMTSCMMPAVAVATLAAATMDRPRAMVAVAGVWAVNQLLGFGLLGYPLTAYALAWGIAIGGAGIAALLVARGVLIGTEPTVPKIIAAFAAAFVAYEVLLFAFALIAGGTSTFMASIVLRIVANEAAWLAVMTALHMALTRAAPQVFGAPRTLRPA